MKLIKSVRTLLFEDSLADFGWSAALYDPVAKKIVAEASDHGACWQKVGVDINDEDMFSVRRQKSYTGYVEGFSKDGTFYTREEALVEWRKEYSKEIAKDPWVKGDEKPRDYGVSTDLKTPKV